MARKKNRKARKIPLSKLDKCIYIIMLMMGFLSVLLIIPLGIVIPEAIAFSSEDVIVSRNTAAIFTSIPLVLFLCISVVSLAGYGLENRQSIFGNNKYRVGNAAPAFPSYPIFSREFRNSLTKNRRQRIKITVIGLLSGLVITAMIVPFGFCPRITLDKNNEIKKYNIFNVNVESNDISEAQKTVIKITEHYRVRSGYSYNFMIEFVFDNEKISFSSGKFGEMSNSEKIEYMIYLKSLQSEDSVYIEGVDMMDKLVDEFEFNEEERALIYDLFDYAG